MGGCCSSTTAVLSEEEKKKKKSKNNKKSVSLSAAAVPIVQREGIEGLADFGYEYRLNNNNQPNSKQHKQPNQPPTKDEEEEIDDKSEHHCSDDDDEKKTKENHEKLSSTPANQGRGQVGEEMAPTTIAGHTPPSLLLCNNTEDDCNNIRLYRIQDDTLITTDNRKSTIPPKIYDQVAKVAQQTVISFLKRDYNLYHLPLFTTKVNNNDDGSSSSKNKNNIVHALVSSPTPPTSSSDCCNGSSNNNNNNNDQCLPDEGEKDNENENENDDEKHERESGGCSSSSSKTSSTLIIINGRGIAQAGILSTRHTIESGIEKGSAVYHIQKALERNMDVVCIDSNAQGSTNGLDTVCRSLSSPALIPYLSKKRSLYILCHSAAGGNLVQHLLKTYDDNNDSNNNNKNNSNNNNNNAAATTGKSTTTTTTTNTPSPPSSSSSAAESTTTTTPSSSSSSSTQKPLFTIDQIKGLVFTDSTHDLQWLSLQKNTTLSNWLQCDRCLYIRNNREHITDTFGPNHKDQPAGTPFFCRKTNTHWLKRFGTIKTVFAGTTDHSLMCYQSRKVIWDFFDSKIRNEEENNGSSNNNKNGG